MNLRNKQQRLAFENKITIVRNDAAIQINRQVCINLGRTEMN